jgi:hypothetical protein
MFTYPRDLPGLAYSKVRRPKHSVSVQTHQSGGEVRTSYWGEPLWEWDLTYELLRDGFRHGRNFDELKQIEGLFLASTGSLAGFAFFDDDDHTATRTFAGNSNGTQAAFTFRRYRGSYNANNGAALGNETIGLLDTAQPFNLYVDNSLVPVSPTDPTYGYTLSTATPKNQQLVFNAAPANGHTFTCDMSWLYYVRFQADSLDFEKFMHQLWTLNKVTLASLRF